MSLALPQVSRLRATAGQSIPTEPGRASATGGAPVTAPLPPFGKPGATFGAPADAAFELAWRQEKLPSNTNLELIVAGASVVLGNAGHALTARRLTDGEVAWTNPVDLSHLVSAGSVIYGLSGQRVSAVNSETGSTLWSASLAGNARWLAISEDRVIVTCDDALLSLRTTDGATIWRQELKDAPVAGATAAAALVSVGLANKSVAAFDAATGTRRWQTPLDLTPVWTLAAEDRIYVGLPSFAVCVLKVSGGAFDWCTTRIKVPTVGPPLVEKTLIYVALLDGSLLTLTRSGAIVRSLSLQGRPALPPSRVGTDLVVPLITTTFIVASDAGRITRVAPPAGTGPLLTAAITSSPPLLLSFSIGQTEEGTLSAYRPKPPAPPTATPPAPMPAPAVRPPASQSTR